MTAVENRLMVMAGGTGGHVFPALAVAIALRDRGTQVTWLGTRKGLEATVVPTHSFDIDWITIEGLRGKGLLSWMLAPFRLLRAIWQSAAVIRRVKPDCVLGMGGFVAGPGGLAARLLGKPLVIHEQNAVAGLTNQYLAKIASRVITGFPQVANLPDTAEWVGNPVRPEIKARPPADTGETFNILVIGGSQGALTFNRSLAQVFAQISVPIRIWHQCGAGGADAVKESYQAHSIDAQVTEFIDDMAVAYTWADLLICRAGAMTIAESCAAGKPALLIPYPFSAGDHQVRNAEAMVSAGAAQMLSNSQVNEPAMVSTLAALLEDRARLATMGRAALSLHKADALTSVVRVCEEFLHA